MSNASEAQALYGAAPRTTSTTQVMSVAEIRRLLRAHGEVPELGDGDDETLEDVLTRDTVPAPPPHA